MSKPFDEGKLRPQALMPRNMVMTTEVIFYTQVVSITGFIITLFVLYRVLVQQKDAVIQLLKERLVDKDEQIAALKSQTPDALASALADRIKVAQDEITRLRSDGATHREEVESKEEELQTIQDRLTTLSKLIKESDLVCPKCGDSLARRESYTIYGGRDGEQEAEVEFVEYECGLSIDGYGKEVSRCRHTVA
ncbi:hypothetical protein [Pseudomonas extremaustralis]|uniref:Uncharacterized protein n=1 Tax=Pseudomonas extremaustralis TaxID=359110 RepID=A0A5C5QNG1_9PSED|nr:hypothetical protein [Pseudomonas extremaustralis]EZI29586.1 hypothetical protein PE143B_0104005 [Pseudomonas extremaustralis 14-3 substr. 14-3b]TWS07052.1 hypothetical protein FIV36_03815 [Pseudomonas extremaustralis]SDF89960.1 hypothetical protein SAMN05216591_4303 [Pseudomonas extremaustralis]